MTRRQGETAMREVPNLGLPLKLLPVGDEPSRSPRDFADTAAPAAGAVLLVM